MQLYLADIWSQVIASDYMVCRSTKPMKSLCSMLCFFNELEFRMRSRSLFIVILLTASVCSRNNHSKNVKQVSSLKKQTLFQESWNQTFSLRTTEEGEVLSIGAVCSNSQQVFCYDLATGDVVTLDTTGSVVSRVHLASIGRNTYVGNDFVVRDSTFIFLNGTDRRLEFFAIRTGKHQKSLAIPSNLLAEEQKRSYRILDRIFIENGKLFIGNTHRLASFCTNLGKRVSGVELAAASGDERFELYAPNNAVVAVDSVLRKVATGKRCVLPVSRYSIGGKRLFMLKNRLYSLQLGVDTVRIVAVE